MKFTAAQKQELLNRCNKGRARASRRRWQELEGQYEGFLSMRSEIASYGFTVGGIGTSFGRMG